MNHADIDAHNALANTSWGTNQGRLGDEYREPMQRGDLYRVLALWAGGWCAVGVFGAAVIWFLEMK